VSKALPSAFLRLQKGQTYQAQQNETWVALSKYQSLEKSYFDALGAYEQLRNR
jgi:hypothetical protein